MKRITIEKKTLFLLLLLFPISFFSKIIQFTFLNSKSFNDAKYILSLMINNTETKGTAFYVTAEFFKKINVFGFTSLIEWSAYISIIFSILLFIVLIKNKRYSLIEIIFIYISSFLLNIYIFNIGKDIIQFVIFLIIYLILTSSYKEKTKIALISVTFIIEALLFRPYYILICYTFILSYFILRKKVNNPTYDKKNIVKFIIIAIFMFLLTLKVTELIAPEEYNEIVNVRDNVTSVLEANTIIKNIFVGNDFFSFSLNYIINFIRIMIPIELITISFRYLPFVVYQVYILYILIKNIKLLNNHSILFVSIILGWFLGVATFEPDFGSVIRHEVALSLFFIYLNRSRLQIWKGELKDEKS